jgi:hypothetical protein
MNSIFQNGKPACNHWSYGTSYTSGILHLRVFVNQWFRTQVYGPDAGEIDDKYVGPGEGYAEGTRLIDARKGVL